jgi:hypothetical protein
MLLITLEEVRKMDSALASQPVKGILTKMMVKL